MVAASHFAPYYPAITRSTLIKTIDPIKVLAGIPPDRYQQQAPGFAATFNAVNTIVVAYAGVQESHLVGDVLVVEGVAIPVPPNGRLHDRVHPFVHGI